MLRLGRTPPRIAIVGGSLGGLFCAIALRSLGCDVEVFEKSSLLGKDRGAGIVLQQEVAEFLDRYGVARVEEVAVPVLSRRVLAPDGSSAHEALMSQRMTSWDLLYQTLRKAFGEGHYHTGFRLVDFEANDCEVIARFDDDRQHVCDLLIGADGPSSTVRRQLLPDVRSRYAGYVAWRGVVEEGAVPDLAAEFADRFTFFHAPQTHILCYLIPGPHGSLAPGERRINWVWYRNVAPGEALDRLLTDLHGRRREFSVPQGFVTSDAKDALRGSSQDILPPVFQKLVRSTAEPFVQTIVDLAVPRMAFGRVCLTGDAAFVPRPHTAASTAKAAANALAMAFAMDVQDGGVVAALSQWEPEQLEMGQRLLALGRRLGDRSQFGR